MGYWAASALAGEFPQPVLGTEVVGASTSPVNFGGLGSYIDQAGAEFDATAAGAGYTVPIPVTASSYPFVQQVVGMGARAAAMEEINSFDPAKVERLREAYRDALRRIADGSLKLSAPLDTTGSGRVLGRFGQTTSPQIVASLGAIRVGFPRDF